MALLKRDILQDAERSSEPIDACAILREHPDLALDKAFVVELAYEEYAQRQEMGLQVDPDAFCEQFPRFRTTLHRVLALDQIVEHNPELFERDQQAWPSIGDTWLGYRLIEELGVGSFSKVYLAQEAKVGNREVALKVSLQGADEAHCLGKLDHPNIVPILSVQQDPASGWTAIAMPFRGRHTLEDLKDGVIPVEKNGSLARCAAAQPTRPEAILRIGAAIADALHHSHSKKIVHGDLKPSNVLLADDGNVLLLDFNLSPVATMGTRRRGGTLPYMAPEQLRCIVAGSEETAHSPQSDLFALGLILHELLTGKHAYAEEFSGMSRAPLRSVADHLLRRQHERLSQLSLPGLESSAVDLIRACLALEPSHRPASAALVAARLRDRGTWPARLRRWALKNPRRIAAGLLLTTSLLVGSTVWLSNQPSQAVQSLEQGLSALRTGRPGDAIDPLQQSLLADPDSVRTRLALACAYQERGDTTLALAEYEELRQLTEDPRVVAGVAYCQALLGNQAVAIAAGQKAMEQGLRTPAVLNNLGFSHHRRADPDSAERLFSEALSRKRDSSIYLNRAVNRWQQAYAAGQSTPVAALDDLQSALALPSPGPLPHVIAARLLASSNTPETDGEVVSHLLRAAELGWDHRNIVEDGFLSRFATHPALSALPEMHGPVRQLDESGRLLPPFSAADL